jgi:hypothetical protein
MRAAVTEGSAAYTRLKAAYQCGKKIVDEGRAPTPEEWNNLQRECDTLHQELQSLR